MLVVPNAEENNKVPFLIFPSVKTEAPEDFSPRAFL